MTSQPIHLLSWLRAALKSALAVSLAVFVTSVLFSGSLPHALEWSLFAASLGGAIGSLQYREALSIPAISRQSGLSWLGSVAWGAVFLLAALKAGEPYPTDQAPFLSKLLVVLGLAAVMSLMCFIPLRWLQGAQRPRHAP